MSYANAVFLLTGTTSWDSVAAGYNHLDSQIDCVGPGSNGAPRVSLGRGGRGGGAGAAAGQQNVTLSGGTITVAIGAKNSGTDTSFDSGAVLAKAATANSVTGGLASGCTGTLYKSNGGDGGAQSSVAGVGGGGGGAGGPAGAGAVGQPGASGSGASGAGDNGNTAGVASATAGNNGTQFDGSHGIGSGSGGTNTTTVFQAGLYGAGGGGNAANGVAPTNGSPGLISVRWNNAPTGTLLPFPWMQTSGGMRDLTGGMRN